VGQVQQHFFSFFLSAFPRQQGNTTPLCCAPGCWGGEMPSGTLCAGPAQVPRAQSSPREGSGGGSRELLSLRSPWLTWRGVGSKRLIPGDFIYRANRKEIAGLDGAETPTGRGEVRFVQTTINSSPRSLLCGEGRMEGTARSHEVGVRSLPRGSLSRRRPCQSLWCRAR